MLRASVGRHDVSINRRNCLGFGQVAALINTLRQQVSQVTSLSERCRVQVLKGREGVQTRVILVLQVDVLVVYCLRRVKRDLGWNQRQLGLDEISRCLDVNLLNSRWADGLGLLRGLRLVFVGSRALVQEVHEGHLLRQLLLCLGFLVLLLQPHCSTEITDSQRYLSLWLKGRPHSSIPTLLRVD